MQANNPHFNQLRLQLLLPTGVLIDAAVTKVLATAENGAFCLLPRHVDLVTALVPGVLSFMTLDGTEGFAAIDRGILVKCGAQVSISAFDGVCGSDLHQLQSLVEERFVMLSEHERKTRTALARLEAGTLRGFLALQERFHG